MVLSDNFDSIHFTECNLHIEKLTSDSIVLDIKNLKVIADHPLYKSFGAKLPRCKMRFLDIQNSKRTIFEYQGDPKYDGFKSKKVIEDIHCNHEKSGRLFYIEGVLDHPLSWVEWEIVANYFQLEVLVSPT